MNKLLIFVLFLLVPSFVQAETESVSLSLPSGFTSSTCPTPVWKNVQVVWKGVQDKRASPSVGQQVKKNKEPIEVSAQPPLEEVFNIALKRLLPACGIQLTDQPTGQTMALKAEIQNFRVDVEKKLLTGTGKAQSRLALIGELANQTTMIVEIGYEIESKKARKKDLRQLTALLNELLLETLGQIPLSRQLQDHIR